MGHGQAHSATDIAQVDTAADEARGLLTLMKADTRRKLNELIGRAEKFGERMRAGGHVLGEQLKAEADLIVDELRDYIDGRHPPGFDVAQGVDMLDNGLRELEDDYGSANRHVVDLDRLLAALPPLPTAVRQRLHAPITISGKTMTVGALGTAVLMATVKVGSALFAGPRLKAASMLVGADVAGPPRNGQWY